ncbi:hypothetical protein ALP75_203793 [Pseudomonas syringae pv. actinidiae]|nr:hypothetical protein ALP75_203793 [Pseudomonas syringae pv. actinidiae]
MQRGVGIAMQVEHHIGDAGMFEQNALHALQLGLRCGQAFECRGHRLTNQMDIGTRVIAQLTFQQLGDRLAQLGEVAVEVLAAAELETPLVRALQQLPQAQRVGDRHQFDDAFQRALLFQLGQAFFQFPGGAHARQLVSVQAGLNVSFALAGAETKDTERAFGAESAPRQYMIDSLHFRPSAGRDSPASGVRRS